jgi:hypothetical protein
MNGAVKDLHLDGLFCEGVLAQSFCQALFWAPPNIRVQPTASLAALARGG